jgi:hypothetical protein
MDRNVRIKFLAGTIAIRIVIVDTGVIITNRVWHNCTPIVHAKSKLYRSLP